MVRFLAIGVVAALICGCFAAVTINVDFSDKIYTSKTTTTLQVFSWIALILFITGRFEPNPRSHFQQCSRRPDSQPNP